MGRGGGGGGGAGGGRGGGVGASQRSAVAGKMVADAKRYPGRMQDVRTSADMTGVPSVMFMERGKYADHYIVSHIPAHTGGPMPEARAKPFATAGAAKRHVSSLLNRVRAQDSKAADKWRKDAQTYLQEK